MSNETEHPLYVDWEAITAGFAVLGEWLLKNGPAGVLDFPSVHETADHLIEIVNAAGYDVEDIATLD